MPEIRFDRLLKLAEWLESGPLGHDAFYFGDYHVEPNNLPSYLDLPEGFCGTLGCAIGECPFAFPDTWALADGFPVLKGHEKLGESFQDAIEFFGLRRDMAFWLFVPASSVESAFALQDAEKFGGIPLEEMATKEEVAANIRAFCEKMASTPVESEAPRG